MLYVLLFSVLNFLTSESIPTYQLCRRAVRCRKLAKLLVLLWYLSKCSSASVNSAATDCCHTKHLLSFFSLDGIQNIKNNYVYPDDYFMTAAMLNHSGRSNNHELMERQTICCVIPKINIGIQRNSSMVAIFC